MQIAIIEIICFKLIISLSVYLYDFIYSKILLIVLLDSFQFLFSDNIRFEMLIDIWFGKFLNRLFTITQYFHKYLEIKIKIEIYFMFIKRRNKNNIPKLIDGKSIDRKYIYEKTNKIFSI